jgi:hypothetical protein
VNRVNLVDLQRQYASIKEEVDVSARVRERA